MKGVIAGILLLTLLCIIPMNANAATIGKSATLANQYRALMRKYNAAGSAFRKAKTDRQRIVAVEQFGTFAPNLLDLVNKHPNDPFVFHVLRQAVQAANTTDSLTQTAWEMNRTEFPTPSKDNVAARIVTLVLRKYLRSDKLSRVCERMRWGYRIEYAKCLREVVRTNPHKQVRAIACLGLAQFWKDRLAVLHLIADRPELSKRYEALFGKDYLPKLQKLGIKKLAKRTETLFEQAKLYGAVKMPYGGTVEEQAKATLYELRNLSIGKQAPNIVGQDQDGKRFQLRDYRGKVVLLYFWLEF